MSTLALQPNLFTTSGTDSDTQKTITIGQPPSSDDSGDSGTNVFSFPKFRALDFAFAATNREAGRINAAAISEEEEQALMDERRSLLAKKLMGTATRRDENRLSYVRWSLDRIDDARHGQSLDFLESRVSMYEGFLDEIKGISRQLSELTAKKRD